MTTFKLHKPEEEVRRVGFVLQKQGIHERIPAQVGLNIDVSGSMSDLFKSGAVQAALERILPVALYFDDDGRIDTGCSQSGEDGIARAGYSEKLRRLRRARDHQQ